MYLYLRATKGVKRAVIHVDETTVKKAQNLTTVLENATKFCEDADVEVACPFPAVEWGFLTTDDKYDLAGRRVKILEGLHAEEKSYYSKDSCIQRGSKGDTNMVATKDGIVWAWNGIKTKVPVSMDLLKKIAAHPIILHD